MSPPLSHTEGTTNRMAAAVKMFCLGTYVNCQWLLEGYIMSHVVDCGCRKFLDGQCVLLYDVLRPMFVQIRHLETLAELCSILRSEIMHEHVRSSRGVSSLRFSAFCLRWHEQFLCCIAESLRNIYSIYHELPIMTDASTHYDIPVVVKGCSCRVWSWIVAINWSNRWKVW